MGKNNEELNIINYALMKKRTDALDQKIDDAIVGVFTNGGSVAFENLPALSLDKVGWAYQITDDFTTTSDFVEGAGKDYTAGTFVSIANTGTDASPVLKYNAMLGVIIVDTALSTTSKNAVENRVITTDLLTRLQKVSAMPQNPSNNDLVLWQGDSTYTLGHVYKYVVASGDSLYAWRVSNPDGLGNNTIVYTKSLTPAETTLYKANGEPYDAETDDPTFEFVSYDSVTNKITVEILDVNSQETWEKTAGRISIDDRIPTSGWVDVTGYITAGQKDGTALGTKATAEGEDTESSGAYAHAEGLRSEAKGNYSHAEGFEATALGESAHAEGSMTYAEGDFSHAEGAQSEVIGKAAHAENWSYVTGDYSHGEGSSIVYGKYAHGEGSNTLASGDASHAGGIGTKAQRRSQMTMGEYNVVDTDGASELVRGKYVIIIGNGTGDNARSNAMTLDWNGNLAVSGEVEDGNGEKISDKADKVTNATSGHLAGLDANGNLTDSGVSPTEDVTVEGNPVTFDSPFEQDAKSVVVSVKPIQAGSGTPSPDNIRPISGIDEVEIEVSGKNHGILDASHIQSTYGQQNSTVTYANNGVIVTSTGNYGRCGFEVPVQKGKTYTISMKAKKSDSTGGGGILYGSSPMWDAEYGAVRDNGISTSFTTLTKTITAESDTLYIGIYPLVSGVSLTVEDFMVEVGEQATDFVPFKGLTETTIPLPSTLYDADVDVTEGSADSKNGMILASAFTWLKHTGAVGNFYCTVNSFNDIKAPVDGYTPLDGYVTNMYETSAWETLFADPSLNGSGVSSNGRICIQDSNISTLEEFNAIANTIQICYPLATPTTLSFDPTDVELLEGTNVVSTNAEKVAVTYGRSLWQDISDLKTDTEGKLDKSDVADVEGDTASRPYSVNEFMLRADGLYKVTQPIASGASITASNTTKTTVGEVLTALLNA